MSSYLIQEEYDKQYEELKGLKEYRDFLEERIKHMEAKQLELAKCLYFAYKYDDLEKENTL